MMNSNAPFITGNLAIPYRTFRKGLHVIFSIRSDKTAFIGETESEEGHCYFTSPVQEVSLENNDILKVKTMNSEIFVAFPHEQQTSAYQIYRFFSALPKSEKTIADTSAYPMPQLQARA